MYSHYTLDLRKGDFKKVQVRDGPDPYFDCIVETLE